MAVLQPPDVQLPPESPGTEFVPTGHGDIRSYVPLPGKGRTKGANDAQRVSVKFAPKVTSQGS